MQNKFEWRGIDGGGCYYGFYREGNRQYALNIAAPGAGLQTKNLTNHAMLVNGAGVGTANTLEAAKDFLSKFFREGHHRQLDQQQRRPRRGGRR
jgi:hypothetical protein